MKRGMEDIFLAVDGILSASASASADAGFCG